MSITPKLVVIKLIQITAILLILFGLLIGFWRFPVNAIIDRQVRNQTKITQSDQSLWAQIPGKMNYNLTKSVNVSLPPRDPKAPWKSIKMRFNDVNRTLSGQEYSPIYSVVNYQETHQLGDLPVNEFFQNVPNFSVMSLWTKLVGDSRPDFIKAFLALSRVKNALRATDIKTRYFTYNLFYWGYNDKSKVNEVALFGIDPKLQDKIFNDTQYGFSDIGTLGKWVQAYKQGNQSAIYNEILIYFQDGDKAKFTSDQMNKIVGENSMMSLLDRVYTQNLQHSCGYSPSDNLTDRIVQDQWTRGLITKLHTIPIFDASNASLFQSSVQHLYNNDLDQSIPSSFHLVAGYEPEFYYFMRYKLGLTEEETLIDSRNAETLLDDDPLSMQTLINPGNLQFFFEKYKYGDFKTIASRFSSNKNSLLTNKQVDAIYKYLLFITEREYEKGGFGNSTQYQEHQAYGSLLSKAMKVSFDHIYRVFKDWYLARFFAAYNNVQAVSCEKYMTTIGITNTTRVADICKNFYFQDPMDVQPFMMVLDNSTAQEILGNNSGLLANETAQLYNKTLNGSISATVALIEQELATAFGCSGGGGHPCSYEELTLMQWASANITQRKNWPAIVNTTRMYILKSSTSISDSNFRADRTEFETMFQRPEILHYRNGQPLTMNAAKSIFDRTNLNCSLDQKWRATLVTDFVMTNAPTQANKDLLASIYNISDFFTFFADTRMMVQEYLLGGAFVEYKTFQVVFGYEEPRFKYIFVNQTDLNDDFFEGNDVDIDAFITPVLSLQSPRVTNQTVSIYTGSINMDQVAKVRFVNLKDYVNINSRIYDGRNFTLIPQSPTIQLQQFDNCTNGNQWAISEADKDNSQLSSYDLSFMTIFDYKENQNYGVQLYSNATNERFGQKLLESNEKPDMHSIAAVKGISLDVKILNNSIKVQPDTGLIMSKNITTNTSVTLQSSQQVVNTFLNGKKQMQTVYLPLPDWDQREMQFPLYSEQTLLGIHAPSYHNEFGYIRSYKNKINNSTIAFAALLGSFGFIFIVSLTVHCCKYRGKKEEAAVYHQVDPQEQYK